MARQRFIHPELWKDPMFGKLEPLEQVMFIGLFSIADDDGRLLADPAYLRAEIFAYKDYPAKKIRTIRDSVVTKCSNVHLYEVDGVEYIAQLKWKDYQRPKYPKASKIPPPFPQDSPNLPPELEPEVETPDLRAGQGLAGKDRDGQGREESSLDVPADADSPGSVVDRHFGLPISAEKLQELERVLRAVHGAEANSFQVLQDAAQGLTLGAIVRVRESVELRSKRVGVGYAVNALKSELQERVA